jgi:uncharacterized protein (TIGR03435 family)
VARLIVLLAFVEIAGLASAQAPPGKLVDLGGYRVHLYCTGSGSPTVMIAGGGYSFDWQLVQDEVSKFTRVCTYDPAGTAWSDPGPGPDCTSRVDEIHTLLTKADVRGPFVLVGLSVGALVARLYANTHPAEVAGMVIVDHAFIDIGAADPKPAPVLPAGTADSPPALLEMTPIVITAQDDPGFRNLPEAVRQLHRWADSRNPVLPSVDTARRCMARVLRPLGNLPLAVVSTGNTAPNYAKLQAQLLALSSNSSQLIADRGFHSVEMSQPEVIVAAVRKVMGAKLEFDVASIKPSKAGGTPNSNFPLGPGDVCVPNGGFFSATDFPLTTYISFAYKIPGDQAQYLLPQLPGWVMTERFDIQARAGGNPTKDQMRLMTRSLLSDRFALGIHNETRQVPVLGLVLAKSGVTGPQLRAHPVDSSCPTVASPSATVPTLADGLPGSLWRPFWAASPCPGPCASGRPECDYRVYGGCFECRGGPWAAIAGSDGA